MGIGNSLRSDDGIAEFVCNQLDAKQFQHLTVMLTQQLDISWADTLKEFDAVVFVDASVYEEGVIFHKLEGDSLPQSSSHHINAGMLQLFSQQLFNTQTQYYVCGIKGYNFDFGFSISASTMQHAEKAIELLTDWINDQ